MSLSFSLCGYFGPALELFIYPLKPHIYNAITPEDVSSSLSTPQLSVGLSKGEGERECERWTGMGAGSEEVETEDATLLTPP